MALSECTNVKDKYNHDIQNITDHTILGILTDWKSDNRISCPTALFNDEYKCFKMNYLWRVMVKCVIKRPIFLDSMSNKTCEFLKSAPRHIISKVQMMDPNYEHICKIFNVNWASPIPNRFIHYVKHKTNCEWEVPVFPGKKLFITKKLNILHLIQLNFSF